MLDFPLLNSVVEYVRVAFVDVYMLEIDLSSNFDSNSKNSFSWITLLL